MTRRSWLVRRSGLGRTALLLLVAVVGTACQLRTDVAVRVAADGSGDVEVGVALDAESLTGDPDALDRLDLDDLVDTGWEVDRPEPIEDGFTRLAIRHEFGTVEEAVGLLTEIAGENGPLRDFALAREDAFAETRYRLEGVIDLTDGVRSLADDPELAAALGGDPFDLVDEVSGDDLQLEFTARLPGDIDSNGNEQVSGGSIWRVSAADPTAVEVMATSTIRRSDRLVWAGVALASGVALVVFVVIRLVLWRRTRRAGRGAPAGVTSS